MKLVNDSRHYKLYEAYTIDEFFEEIPDVVGLSYSDLITGMRDILDAYMLESAKQGFGGFATDWQESIGEGEAAIFDSCMYIVVNYDDKTSVEYLLDEEIEVVVEWLEHTLS